MFVVRRIERCVSCEREAHEQCTRWPCTVWERGTYEQEIRVCDHRWVRTREGDLECIDCDAWQVGGIWTTPGAAEALWQRRRGH